MGIAIPVAVLQSNLQANRWLLGAHGLPGHGWMRCAWPSTNSQVRGLGSAGYVIRLKVARQTDKGSTKPL